MEYTHRWEIKLDTGLFPEPFLEDVREVVLDFFPILKDVDVNAECIRFNGQEGNGHEAFFFHHENYHNAVKTGSVWIKTYDKPICAVLLLAIYHFGDQINVWSDGLVSRNPSADTIKASKEWESAITFVEERFGYFFDRIMKEDEYGQYHIKIIPLLASKKA